jgi:hypothetical protein
MEARGITHEHEKSYAIGVRGKVFQDILRPLINDALNNQELQVVQIKDLYFGNQSRIRLQDDTFYITEKKVDSKKPAIIAEDTVNITKSSEVSRANFVGAVKEIIFKRNDLNFKKFLIKASLSQIVDAVKYYFIEKLLQALFSDKFAKFVPNSLDKMRVIIPLTDAELHIDFYDNRMKGFVKIDLELSENLTEEREQEVFRNYKSLLQGYNITRSEKRVYQNRRFIRGLLPYEMMFTNKKYFNIPHALRYINRQLGISKNDIPYIIEILNILKSPNMYNEIPNNLI